MTIFMLHLLGFLNVSLVFSPCFLFLALIPYHPFIYVNNLVDVSFHIFLHNHRFVSTNLNTIYLKISIFFVLSTCVETVYSCADMEAMRHVRLLSTH